MELRHVRYFVALAENLSFTRAARQMHVSQPTLSHQIKQLESELGKRLVVRHHRGVSLTPEGESFIAHAATALGELDAAVLGVRRPALPQAQQVRIGAPSTLAVSIVPDSLAILLASEGRISVRLEEITSAAEIQRRLVDETLDIGLLYPPLARHDLVLEALYEEQAVLFLRRDHRLARRKKIRLLDLHGERVILPLGTDYRQLLEALLREVGAKPEVAMELVGSSSIPRLVEKTGFIAIVAEHAVAPAEMLRAIPIERPMPVRVPSMCTKRVRRHSPAVAAVAAAIRQLATLRQRRR